LEKYWGWNGEVNSSFGAIWFLSTFGKFLTIILRSILLKGLIPKNTTKGYNLPRKPPYPYINNLSFT